MANIDIIEDQSVSPDGDDLNWEHSVRSQLRERGYIRVRPGSAFANYAHLVKFPNYYICDLLIVARAEDMETAEELVPRLEAEYARIRRSILQGHPIHPDFSVQEHHFLTLHKPYVRRTYEKDGLPIGFLIRPLILVQETDQWDYFSSQSVRIDVLSFDSDSLAFYLDRHAKTLLTKHALLLNLKKFRYWKLANTLLDHGHYFIIGSWVVYLFFMIFQASFPLTLGGMIAVSSVAYGGFISFAYLAYRTFQHCQASEIREIAHHASSSALNSDDFYVVEVPPEDTDIETTVPNQPEVEVSRVQEPVPLEIEPSAPVVAEHAFHEHNRYYNARIKRSIKKLVMLHESKQISTETGRLLRYIFNRIIGQTKRNVPRNDPLPDLLRKARHNVIIVEWFDSLVFWVRKIESETPFAPNEMEALKRDLLYLLYELNLLPSFLRQAVELRLSQQQEATPSPANPLTDSSQPGLVNEEGFQPNQDIIESAPLAQSEPRRSMPPPSVPNLDAATLPISRHIELAGLNAEHLETITDDELSGVYCILFIDQTAAGAGELIDRFNKCTKNLDVANYFFDVSLLNVQELERKYNITNAPSILVGCGRSRQPTPYGETGDDIRLLSLIEDYKRTQQQESLPPVEPSARAIAAPLRPQCEVILRDRQMMASSENEESQTQASALKLQEEAEFRAAPISPDEEIATEHISEDRIKETDLLKFQRGSVLIDGSNLAFLLKDHGGDPDPTLDCVFEVIEDVQDLGIEQKKIAVFFDANIPYKLNERDKQRLAKHEQEGLFRMAPSHTDTDTILVRLARRLKGKFVVISNDLYQDRPAWFSSHRIGVALDTSNHAFLAIESVRDFLNAFHGGSQRDRRSNRRRVPSGV